MKKNIEPSKITKPIQLLAAWLAGLILVNGSFLTSANLLSSPTWAAGLLIIASILNVPLFLIALFLLQTKFRPEMQEDEFYAKYLESRYSSDSGTNEVIISQPQGSPPRIHLPSRSDGETRLMVNDMLTNYSDIRGELLKADIKINSTFGSISENPDVPPHLLFSFGRWIDIPLLQKVIRVLGDKIDYVSLVPDGWEADTIYIGSYAYREDGFSKNIKWNQDISTNLLSPALSHDDIAEILK